MPKIGKIPVFDRMQNNTQVAVVAESSAVVVAVENVASACAAAATGLGWWVYEKVITNPLRIFYFVGPIWKNAPPDEICHSITGVPASWWIETRDRQQACSDLLERRFNSFDKGVMTTVYFAFLSFVLLQVMFTCCCVRPIAKALKVR